VSLKVAIHNSHSTPKPFLYFKENFLLEHGINK
jgi:hypothetical protein